MHITFSLSPGNKVEATKRLLAASADKQALERFSFPLESKDTTKAIYQADPEESLLVVLDSDSILPQMVRIIRQDVGATAPTFILAFTHDPVDWAFANACQLYWHSGGYRLKDLVTVLLSKIPATWEDLQRWVKEKPASGYPIQLVVPPPGRPSIRE